MLDQEKLRHWEIARIANGTGEPRSEGINMGIHPIDFQSKLPLFGTATPLGSDPEQHLIRAETEAEEDTMEFPSSPEVITVAPNIRDLLQARFDERIVGCNPKKPVKFTPAKYPELEPHIIPFNMGAFLDFAYDYAEESFHGDPRFSNRDRKVGKMSHIRF